MGPGALLLLENVDARHSQGDIEQTARIMEFWLDLRDEEDRREAMGRVHERLRSAGKAVSSDLLVTKPGIDETENEFRWRLRDPGDFEANSFRRIAIKRDRPRVFGIVGRLKGETTTTLQALRFPKGDGWTREQVQQWLDAHPDIGKSWWGWEDDAVAAAIDDLLTELRAKLAESPERIEKFIRAEIKAVDKPGFEAEVLISTPSIDRDREVIEPRAFRNAKGKRLPLVDSHLLGTGIRKQIGEAVIHKIGDEGVTAKLRYFVGRGNEDADWAWTLVGEDIAAFSHGFIPKKWEDADLSDEKVVREVMDGKRPLRRYTEIESLEVSQVIVGSNRDAVQRAVTKGLYTDEEAVRLEELFDLKEKGELPVPEVPDPKTKDVTAAQFPADTTVIKPKPKKEPDLLEVFEDDVPASTEITKDGNWKVGGARGLPMADDDSWDGSGAASAIFNWAGGEDFSPAKARRGFVVYDASEPENRGSYKLPFAKVQNGRLVASRRGLVAVRVVLAGGRGGVDIPENVQTAAVRFVNAYLGEGEQEDGKRHLRVLQAIHIDWADLDADQVVIRDADSEVLFRGCPTDLEDLLTRPEPQQRIVSVEIDEGSLSETLAKFTVDLKAALEETAGHVKDAVAKLPTIPPYLAEYPNPADLAKAIGDIVAKTAARIAAEEVAKAKGNVDFWPS